MASFLILSILFSGWVGNFSAFYEHPKDVPVEALANFLDQDNHWRWRYLTLGFGSYDFCRLSILSNATTLDGWYYRGRNIPSLADSGAGYLSGAKFENSIPALKSILVNASQYNIRFVFCNDKFYEPILNETGFGKIDTQYEQVTLWVKLDSSELEIDEIVRANHSPTLQEYMWGLIPMVWLIGYIFLNTLKISKNRDKILAYLNSLK